MTDHPDTIANAAPKREWLDRQEFPGTGRGIVICAGGVRMFTNAWVLVWQLRRVLGCELPVEVWHLGRGEMSTGMRGMLENLGAKVVDAHDVLLRFPARIADGWQLKPYALIMSGFREVLMLDADNVPAVDPAFLFDRPEFVTTGAVFWPDLLDIAQANPIWEELGLPAMQRTSFETGQMLIDKSRHGDALATVLRLNEDADRYYRLIYGDKDTFLVAWLLASAQYQLMPHRPIADRYVLYQRDFGGRIVFQHRTNGKWKYGGPQVQAEGFVHGASCEEALHELRRIWNGRIFEPPARSPAAMRMEQLMEGRLFIAARPGEEDREIELLAYNQIGKGRDFEHDTWHVVETEPGCFALRIMDRHQVTCELQRRDDDHWLEAGSARRATSLTATGRSIETGRRREYTFARALCQAVLRDSGWTPEGEEELSMALKALCRLDPGLADEVADYASAGEELDSTVRDGLLRLAADQKRLLAKLPERRDVRPRPEILFDPRYYVRP
ncbi:hypothetical protein [Mesorhizobium sp. KR9-304]|uniref:hypothetical protein n=1 Tax=Mesorhizobium sp. KR9-304 TaxID=3156614 RepID=UPI0032B3A3DC